MRCPTWFVIAALGLVFSVSACTESETREVASEAQVEPISGEEASAVVQGESSVTKTQPKTPPTTTTPRTARLSKAPGQGSETPEVAFKGKRIALVHTANVVGELEPCG